MVRVSLRWSILLITVFPLVTLACATVWIVNRSITRQVHQGIHDDLRRASAVLENVLTLRAQSLAIATQMTVQDPKFFSVLTIPGSRHDPQLRATVSGVARDFNAITQSDLFEVTGPDGHLLAGVGHDATVASGRDALLREVLSGRPLSNILVQPGAHYQVSATPVYAGGRVIGTLLLGARIGEALAERLRQLTRSEVTFVSHGTTTGSTLESAEDRDAVLAAVARLDRHPGEALRGGTLLEVRGGAHPYLTLIRPLPLSEPAQGQYYVMQRALDAETVFLRETQVWLLGLGSAAVLVALLAGFLIAEQITAPIQRLVRGAEEMERGNYDFPLAVRARNEIGALAARFDEMRQRQREYVHNLQEIARVKSEFISVASHELRTPLTVITGFHELMLDGTLGEITPRQRQGLKAIGTSVESLQRLGDDAMRMAQIDENRFALHRTDCDVAGLVDEALTKAMGLAPERRVKVGAELSPELGTVRVDGPSMVQALVNLVGNGIRYTPDGGRVVVRARRDGEWLTIAVTDTGVGMDPARQKHLLDRSLSVRESLHHHSSRTLEFNSAGLGLGLPIANGIIEAHGGRLVLESVLAVGSTFTVWIPIESITTLENAA